MKEAKKAVRPIGHRARSLVVEPEGSLEMQYIRQTKKAGVMTVQPLRLFYYLNAKLR